MALNEDSITQETIAAGENEYVRALLNDGWRWTAPGNPGVIHWAAAPGWTAAQVQTLTNMFAAWQAVANVTFQEVTNQNDAEIVLHQTDGAQIDGFGGYSGTPGETGPASATPVTFDDVTIAEHGQVHTYLADDGFLIPGQPNTFVEDPPGSGNFIISAEGFELILHEVGHALGLKHPHDGGAEATADRFPGVTGDNSADLGDNDLNQSLYTLMSYNHWRDPNGPAGAALPAMATPMAFDIAAIQRLYGANTTINGGDDTYVLPDPGSGPTYRCIWDTGGTDEIRYNGAANAVIDLRPATLDNSATGGGVPSYTFTVNPADLTRTIGRGFTIAGDVTGALADEQGVTGVIIENASGGSGNDEITGNGVANVLGGNAGDDVLAGAGGNDHLRGGVGVDTMRGGAGDDTYDVDNKDDDVSELAGEGTDTVLSSLLHYTLPEFVENLTLDYETHFLLGRVGIGNGLDNLMIGGGGSDVLKGLAGRDRLDGGLGIDLLVGGSDDDTYVVTAFDVVVELPGSGGGVDTVETALKRYELADNVENLIFTGTGDFEGRGNLLANRIISGNGDDELCGLHGADILDAGRGDDLLDGGNGADIFLFRAGFGDDRVLAFDFNPSGGQDRMDISALVLAANFNSEVDIDRVGNNTVVTIDGESIVLAGVKSGIDRTDFILG
jgi:Ca2+-binding RTX toxin-like protein